jgi:uncharacterized protein (UPF0332 family)
MTLEQQKLLSTIMRANYAWLRQLAAVGLVDIQQIDAVITDVVRARMQLARGLLAEGKRIKSQSQVTQRQIISLVYYCQYHAARAVVLHVHRFDCDSHEQLPVEIEKILGKATQDSLTHWRKMRNKADYEPFIDFDLKREAGNALEAAATFVRTCRGFLKKRGVKL